MTWLVVGVVVALVVVRFELFLRAHRYQPSVKDDEYAWTLERMRASDRSPHTVALLGSSRIMVGFSGEAFTQALPGWRYVELAINGTTPVASLRDLAGDPDFRGVALVDMNDTGFYRGSRISQDRYVATYHRRWRSLGNLAERWLTTQVQSRLALLATRGFPTFTKWIRTGEWPKPPYVVTRADRTRYADFSLADVARERASRLKLIENFEKTTSDPKPWLDDVAALEPAVEAIQSRGGQVVYIRMPTCDERWDADERLMPKAQFWDQLPSRTRAVVIHFKDFPELSKYPCPDSSHIDSKHAPEFTHALIAILKSRGVFK